MPAAGQTHRVDLVVTPQMTAASHADRSGESYPAVLSTPEMISQFERAAAALMQPELGPGQLSVGVVVNVSHLSAVGVGEAFHVEASFAGQEGKLSWFDVTAHGPRGVIGKGRHARTVVEVARLMASLPAAGQQ